MENCLEQSNWGGRRPLGDYYSGPDKTSWKTKPGDSHRDGDIQMSGKEISEKKRLHLIILALELKVKRNKI